MYSGAEVCTETLGTVTDPLIEAIPCECSAQTHLCSGTLHMLVPPHRVSLEQFVNLQFAKLLFPRWLSVKEPAYQYRKHRRRGFDPWVGEILWRRAWQPTAVFLLGESHEQESLAGYSLWGRN